MIDFAIKIFASPAFPLVTLLLGFLIGNRLAIGRDRRKEFNEAAAKFRSAFKDELLALNPALSRNSVDTAELLETAFDKHRMAVFDFSPFLPSKSIKGFDEAWHEYYRYDNAPEGIIHGLAKYSGVGHGYEEKRRLRLLAAERIEKILKFAEHK